MYQHKLLILLSLGAVFLAPGGSAAKPWRFVMTCDSRGSGTGVNELAVSELVDEILRRNVDLVIFAGDLVYGARVGPAEFEEQLWNWVRVMQPVYDAGIRVLVCRGNHEVGDMWDAEPGQLPDPADNYALRWLRVFGNDDHPELRLPDNGPADETYMTYAVVHKNALVVGLDQYAGTRHQLAHRHDQAWLDAQLAANTQPHVFVFGHEPAFRALHFDCLDAYPAERDAFWNSLKWAGARVYLCGHDHFYDHARIDDGDGVADNDIHQLIVGTAGAYPYMWFGPYRGNNTRFTVEQIHHAERFGYVLVEVDDLEVTLTWMERQDNDLSVPGVYEGRDVWRYNASPRLILLSPQGGQRVVAGRPHAVTWTTAGAARVARVFIEYSLDGGASWITAGEADNTGTFAWQPPLVNSNACLVRIGGVGNPTLKDISEAPFSIFECRADLAADLNHDCYVDMADLALLMGEWLACGNPLDPACWPLP